jgi:putative oxidoreductase
MKQDFIKLFLRITLAGMMLFHGLHKIIYGIDGIKKLVVANGFWEILAYGVYVGEVIAPIFILLGAYTRAFSAILALNMAIAVLLAHQTSIFTLTDGIPTIELPLLYFTLALLCSTLGGGKYALNHK